MARLLGRLSLRTWVLLQTGLIIALLFLAFAAISSSTLSNSTSEVLAHRLLIAEGAASRLDMALERSLQRLEREIIESSLSAGDLRCSADALRHVRQELQLTPAYIVLVDGHGQLLCADPDWLPGDDVVRPELAGAVQEHSRTVTDLLPDLRGQGQVFYLVRPVASAAGDRQVTALAAIDPAASNLSEFLQPFSLGSTGSIELVNRQGITLASDRPENLLVRRDHAEQLAALIDTGKTTTGTCHRCHEGTGTLERQGEVMAFAPSSVAPWGVAIRQSEEEALAPVQTQRSAFILLGFLSLAAVLGLSWSTSRRLIESARRLQNRASGMAGGDLTTPIPAVSGAEMIRLADALEMTRRELQRSQHSMQQRSMALERTIEEKTRDLMSLVLTSEVLVSVAAPDTLFNTIVTTAAQTLGGDGCVLFLWDDQRSALVARASIGYDHLQISEVALQPGEGIAGKVFQSGEAAQSTDPAEIDAMLSNLSPANRERLLAARGGRELRGFLCVPLVSRDGIRGCLFAAGLQGRTAAITSSMILARTFATVASALLEILQLLDEASQVQALRRTNQLKTEFLSNISHELQTPLAALKASLDFLAPTLSNGASEAQIMLFENARRSTERLQRLVADLIDMARLQVLQLELNLEVVDLKDTVEQVCDAFAPVAAGKSQSLALSLPPTSPLVSADRRRIEQVIGNLLMNAHQHVPEGGRISVGLKEHHKHAVVLIEDTGPGIAQEDIARLFDRFYRGQNGPVSSGLGLGLAIAKGLVELHGGQIWVESEPGKGSTFCFSLLEASRGEDSNRGR